MTHAPKPGQAVRGSRSGQPIMALFDLMGRQWAMRILWELWQAPLGFSALQASCGMSPTILSRRLQELVEAGLISKREAKQYQLTALGEELQLAMEPVRVWASRWQNALPAEAKS